MGNFSKIRINPGQWYIELWHNVAITIWLSRPDAAAAKSSVEFAEELLKSYAKFSVLHVIEEGVGLPTAEGGNEFISGARKNTQHVACVGLLLPEANIVVSMLRVFVRSVRTVLRGDMNTVLEQKPEALARQVADIHTRLTGVRLAANDLVTAIEEARRTAKRAG